MSSLLSLFFMIISLPDAFVRRGNEGRKQSRKITKDDICFLLSLFFILCFPCSHRADLPWKPLERATCKSITPFFPTAK
jgi:hypothetical protein